MTLGNRSFKRHSETDVHLNQFITSNDRFVDYVKNLPREELERKYLLSKMKEERGNNAYEQKVIDFINRPENAEFKESLMKSFSSGIKNDATRQHALLKEAKIQIHKQGIKMSM